MPNEGAIENAERSAVVKDGAAESGAAAALRLRGVAAEMASTADAPAATSGPAASTESAISTRSPGGIAATQREVGGGTSAATEPPRPTITTVITAAAAAAAVISFPADARRTMPRETSVASLGRPATAAATLARGVLPIIGVVLSSIAAASSSPNWSKAVSYGATAARAVEVPSVTMSSITA